MTNQNKHINTDICEGNGHGPFRLVLADPPWSRNQVGKHGASQHYDLMKLDDIKGMGDAVKALTAPDAVLLLWVTNSGLLDGIDVLQAWGFRYVQHAVWDKRRTGLGSAFRNSHETLLLGYRGRPGVKFHGQRSVVDFPVQDHSHKPEELFPAIERMYDGPYLELFARRRPNTRSDWSIWGNEVESDISLAPWGYFVPSDFAWQDELTVTHEKESERDD